MWSSCLVGNAVERDELEFKMGRVGKGEKEEKGVGVEGGWRGLINCLHLMSDSLPYVKAI